MSQVDVAPSALLAPWADNQSLLKGGLVSLGLHLAGLVLLLWLPTLSSPTYLGPVYTVNLVGLPDLPPGPAPAPAETAKAAAPAAETKSEAVAVKAPEQAELIPVGREPEKAEKLEVQEPEAVVKMGTPKKSSKESKVQPEEEIDKALAKIEKKVDKKEAQPKSGPADQKHLQNALARVTQKVQSGAYGLGGGGGGGGGQGDNRFAYYYTQIWQKVRSNWILPEEWQQKKLEAILIISVMPNGAIANIKFEKRSGSPAFDQSVMWAVERSNPLPPFPQGMSLEKQEIGIRFNPEG